MTAERCVRFGSAGHLAGVVTDPARERKSGPPRLLLLVSAGLVPMRGPFRLYTELARRLSCDGFTTLRFDLGGLGDSQTAGGGDTARLRTEQDLGQAIDHLTARCTPEAVVLGGLCSGADDAFRQAALDPRVTAVFLIDPFAWSTPGFLWRRLLLRGARRLLSLCGLTRTGAAAEPLVEYQSLGEAEARPALQALLRRGVSLHFFYTGGHSAQFNHRGQLAAMFRGLDLRGVSVDHLPRFGHTQLLAADRSELLEAIARRLDGARAGLRG